VIEGRRRAHQGRASRVAIHDATVDRTTNLPKTGEVRLFTSKRAEGLPAPTSRSPGGWPADERRSTRRRRIATIAQVLELGPAHRTARVNPRSKPSGTDPDYDSTPGLRQIGSWDGRSRPAASERSQIATKSCWARETSDVAKAAGTGIATSLLRFGATPGTKSKARPGNKATKLLSPPQWPSRRTLKFRQGGPHGRAPRPPCSRSDKRPECGDRGEGGVRGRDQRRPADGRAGRWLGRGPHADGKAEPPTSVGRGGPGPARLPAGRVAPQGAPRPRDPPRARGEAHPAARKAHAPPRATALQAVGVTVRAAAPAEAAPTIGLFRPATRKLLPAAWSGPKPVPPAVPAAVPHKGLNDRGPAAMGRAPATRQAVRAYAFSEGPSDRAAPAGARRTPGAGAPVRPSSAGPLGKPTRAQLGRYQVPLAEQSSSWPAGSHAAQTSVASIRPPPPGRTPNCFMS